ncbi:TPA: helix-turn-helix transcriptional regulator [Clostridioides difficile]|uniref:helix-turn-helix domain-containing protein n=1 Tax=Clostridioides difficile TaxID=1496 RepID=UPI00038CF659|nr:helix-turn-helix transcriptional regulator [Clostridioides difficile]EQJ93855.1 helix-turn-helix family protein [Clostridioides difficile P51]MDO0459767.1 helix-turn-helix domain-containing protein [Clostridioides difficile]CZR81522.1 HTH-type transcriptional regulator ImmR [Clostridioides difficile]SJO78395.1 HTH-type transcriptional regulator immR [Clostridioides difficile]HBF1697460.1 helix-turn-helix transcriptional regulator [Clostridioides difficile]
MIGKKLAQLRRDAGLNQRDLAKKLNIGNSTLAMYELDKREPDFKTLEKIADFFNVSVDYLFGRTSSKEIEIDEDVKEITDMIFELDEESRKAIFHMLDTLIKKNK